MKKGIKTVFYNALDLFTLNKGIRREINGFKIYFPAKWSRYFESDYEKENVAFIKQQCKPGMTVIDIGAHLGLMSVTLSKLTGSSGKVYSFEPTPNTFKILNKVVQINSAENIVETVNMAVAREDGEIDFYLAKDEGSNSNSLVSKNHRQRVPIKMKVTSLDNFVLKRKIKQIDFIKIDAEGSEYDVLRGAEKTISQFKPKLILALHPPLIENNKQKIEDIYDFLKKYNYTIEYQNKIMDRETFCTTRDFFDVHLIATT